MKQKSRLRRLLSISLAAIMIGGAGLSVPGAVVQTGIVADAASNVSINAKEVNLYILSPSYKEKLSLPQDAKREFQLKVTGASSVYYEVTEGDSVTVTSDGLIKPLREVWQETSSGFSWGVDGSLYPDDDNLPDDIWVRYRSGESEITVTADGVQYRVKVTVNDYADQYAENVIDDYIKNNITSNMTDEQKFTKIAQFVASYNYDYRYQSLTDMIVFGGGDCWASSETAVTMAKKLGYTAVVRNGNQDFGGGSGHQNALIYTDNGYYIIEAGYSGDAPRYYDVYKRSSLFCYRSDTYGGIQVYQYDGFSDSDTFEIPSTIDGKTVTSIGKDISSYSYNTDDSKIKRVIIPDTVKSIGSEPFGYFNNLEEVNIPASLEDLTSLFLTGCTNIKKITSKSPRFKVSGTLIYDDVKKSVVSASSVENPVIPSDMKEIGDYAFCANNNLKSVSLPSCTEKLGVASFRMIDSLKEIDLKNTKITDIGRYCFDQCNNLTKVTLPDTLSVLSEGAFCRMNALTEIDLKNTKVTEIGEACFAEDVKMTRVNLPKTLTAIDELAFYGCSELKSIVIPESVTSIGKDVFTNCSSLEAIYGKAGSAAEAYAKENNIPFKLIKDVSSISLSDSAITLEIGKSYNLSAVFSPADATDQTLEWKTGNTAVATVENGKIKAVGKGRATILAKTENGKTASCRVNVVDKLVNNSSVLVNTVQVGDDIRIMGAAKGGSGDYQYAFYFKRSTNTNWKTLSDFSAKSNAVVVPNASAYYEIKVVAKDKSGLKAEKTFTVLVLNSMSLRNVSSVGASTISKGGSVKLYGKSVGGAKPVKYQFYFKRETNANWKRLNAADENATSAKVAPTAAGVYDLKVVAVDAKGVKSEKTFKLTVK